MTLLLFDGMQDAALLRKPEFSSPGGSLSRTGRDGSTNGSIASNSNQSVFLYTLPSAAATCFCGIGFMATNTGVLGNVAGTVMAMGSSTSNYVALGLTSLGYLEVRRMSTTGAYSTGTVIGTSSGHDPLDEMNVWHHIQMKVKLDPTTGVVEIKLDGVTVLTLTGANTGTAASVSLVGLYGTLTGGNGMGNDTCNFDDLWICDAVDATATQGRPNNDFLGDLKVTTLIPTANGDATAWTKSTGSNAAALLDEVPPNTTDYISSSTSAQQELMTMPDLPATTGNVLGVRLVLYSAKTDAGACSVKPLVKENSTVTAGAAKPLSTTYTCQGGEFLFTKPSASTTPWTASDVNGMQAGVELA